MLSLENKEIMTPTDNGPKPSILLNTIEYQGNIFGIFTVKNILENYLSNNSTYLDFNVFSIYDFAINGDGEIDISLEPVKEVPQKLFDKILEIKDQTKLIIDEYKAAS